VTSKGPDGSTLVMRRHTHREERITTEPIDGEDPKSRMYIHEAPESIPNTRLWERREEGDRGRGNINKTTQFETGGGKHNDGERTGEKGMSVGG